MSGLESRAAIAAPELVAKLYEEEVALRQQLDALRQDRKKTAKDMNISAEERQSRGKALKEELAAREPQHRAVQDKLLEEALRLPNDTHPATPIGTEPEAREVFRLGSPPSFSFSPQSHLELAERLQLVDFEAAARVAGPKFSLLERNGALLEMALVQWALVSMSQTFGFTPLLPPDLAHHSVVSGCGFQPRGDESQIYHVDGGDLCLAATSEIALAGMHANTILGLSSLDGKASAVLPLRYAAFSHCFRREAGSRGQASKGLYRLHQFSKVEMFVVCPGEGDGKGENPPRLVPEGTSLRDRLSPEDADSIVHSPGDQYLLDLVGIQLHLIEQLGLHARVLEMPTQELGASAFRKFDVEVWMPGRGTGGSFGEVCSASDCTDYQSRRLGIRYRLKAKENRFAHTLNATVLAVPRIIIALLETHQEQDGSVRIPEVLQPFLGGLTKLEPPK